MQITLSLWGIGHQSEWQGTKWSKYCWKQCEVHLKHKGPDDFQWASSLHDRTHTDFNSGQLAFVDCNEQPRCKKRLSWNPTLWNQQPCADTEQQLITAKCPLVVQPTQNSLFLCIIQILLLFPSFLLHSYFPRLGQHYCYFPLLPLSVQFLLYWLPGVSFFLPSFNMGCKAASCLAFLFTIHLWICMLCSANFNWKPQSFFFNGKCERESIFNALVLPVLEPWVFF